jgi:MoaA/NifB/PqqE/SkfB family radical SAM enzyme
MPLSAFLRIIGELGPWARTVHLYNWGEPLLHRDLWRMVRIAKGYGLRVWLSTTLNDLRQGAARELVASGLDRLSVSIDGASAETYGRYRKGGNLEEVVANLRGVVAEKKRQGSRTPLVKWQFIPMRHNEHEIDAARARARELGVAFTLKKLRIDMVNFNEGPLDDRAKSDREWLPRDNRHNRYRECRASVCRYLWDRTTINWNGVVAPCCRVYRESDCFGSMLDGGFTRIWNGPAYQRARGIFTRGGDGGTTVCERCVIQGNIG